MSRPSADIGSIVVRDKRTSKLFWMEDDFIDDAIVRHSLSPSVALVYVYYSRRANRNSSSFASVADVSAKLAMDRKTVSRANSALVAAGLIEIVSGKKAGRPNVVYVLGCTKNVPPPSPENVPPGSDKMSHPVAQKCLTGWDKNGTRKEVDLKEVEVKELNTNTGAGDFQSPNGQQTDGDWIVEFYCKRMNLHHHAPDVRPTDRDQADEQALLKGFRACLAAVYVLTDVIDKKEWEAQQGRPFRFLWLRWDQLDEKAFRYRTEALRFAEIEGIEIGGESMRAP